MDDRDGHSIQIAHQSRSIDIGEEELRRAVQAALEVGGSNRHRVSLAIVDDPTLARLHQAFMGDPTPTDVLSFDLTDDPDRPEGEVVVSAETARRQAGDLGGDPRAELLLYVVHGVLHLVGFDDATPEEAASMHRQEDRLLEALGYERPYAQGGAPQADGRPGLGDPPTISL